MIIGIEFKDNCFFVYSGPSDDVKKYRISVSGILPEDIILSVSEVMRDMLEAMCTTHKHRTIRIIFGGHK